MLKRPEKVRSIAGSQLLASGNFSIENEIINNN